MKRKPQKLSHYGIRIGYKKRVKSIVLRNKIQYPDDEIERITLFTQMASSARLQLLLTDQLLIELQSRRKYSVDISISDSQNFNNNIVNEGNSIV